MSEHYPQPQWSVQSIEGHYVTVIDLSTKQKIHISPDDAPVLLEAIAEALATVSEVNSEL